MAFRARNGRVTGWSELVVSYAEDPHEALEEVLRDMGVEDCDICPAGDLSAKKEEK